MAIPLERVEVLWYGLVDHPEDVAVAADGTVWCGGEDGQVYRGHLNGEPREVVRLPGRVYGIVLDGAGNAYCCVVGDPTGLFRVGVGGESELLATGADGRRCTFPNQPAFLPDGTLLFSDSGEWGADEGCLFRVSPGGDVSVADTSVSRYPNGLVLSPDGSYLAVVESTLPGVVALTLDSDGELSGREVLVELPGLVPDGIAFDERNRMLIACWAPDAVYLVEQGRVEPLVHDPQRVSLNSPTNAAFIPGTRRVVCANIGERFLSEFEHDAAGAPVPAPG